MRKRPSYWIEARERDTDVVSVQEDRLESISPVVFSSDDRTQVHKICVLNIVTYRPTIRMLFGLPSLPFLAYISGNSLPYPIRANQFNQSLFDYTSKTSLIFAKHLQCMGSNGTSCSLVSTACTIGTDTNRRVISAAGRTMAIGGRGRLIRIELGSSVATSVSPERRSRDPWTLPRSDNKEGDLKNSGILLVSYNSVGGLKDATTSLTADSPGDCLKDATTSPTADSPGDGLKDATTSPTADSPGDGLKDATILLASYGLVFEVIGTLSNQSGFRKRCASTSRITITEISTKLWLQERTSLVAGDALASLSGYRRKARQEAGGPAQETLALERRIDGQRV